MASCNSRLTVTSHFAGSAEACRESAQDGRAGQGRGGHGHRPGRAQSSGGLRGLERIGGLENNSTIFGLAIHLKKSLNAIDHALWGIHSVVIFCRAILTNYCAAQYARRSVILELP